MNGRGQMLPDGDLSPLFRMNIVAVRNQAGFELNPWSTMLTTCSANSR